MLKNPFQQKKLPELLFWWCFFLLLVIHCIENTTLTFVQPRWLKGMYLFRNLLYLILLGKIAFLTHYRTGQLWALLGLMLSAGISFLFTGEFTLLEFLLVVFAAKDVPSQKIIWMLVVVKGAAVAATLLCSDLNLLPKLYYIHEDAPLDTLGFCHRNVLGSNMVVLCLCWLYLRYRRLCWLDLLGCVTLAFATYFLCISRSSLLIMLLSIAAFFLVRTYYKQIRRFPYTGKIVHGLFLSFLLLSLLGTVFYDQYSDFWRFMDSLLTRRLSFANECFDQHGFTLFGQEMPFSGTMNSSMTEQRRLILDNSYMRSLIYHGLIPGGLFLFQFWFCLYRSWKKKLLPMVLSLLIIAMYGVSESFMLDVFYCFPMMAVCVELLRQPKEGPTFTPMEYTLRTLRPIGQWLRSRMGGKK